MLKVNSYYDVKVVEIVFSGNDSLGFFEDKITFIYNPCNDKFDSQHDLYTCCENCIKELQVGTQTIEHAIAYVYTLDRQLINQFNVLD
jgi:hypothetical protein